MRIRIYGLIVLVLILPVMGCAPALKTANKDLLEKKPDEGLVIGSLQIKLWDPYGDKASKWWVTIEDKKWHFIVNNIKTDAVTKFFKQGEFELTTIAGGEETPFLAKLPAGNYRFEDVYKNGFTAWRGYAGKYFYVEAGQTTYIGRLVVVMPKYPGNWFGVEYRVESALSETLPKLLAKYSNIKGDIQTKLMRIDNSLPDLTQYDKDRSIIMVLQNLYKWMGPNAFVIYDHWGHDKSAIGIASPQNHSVLVYISTFGTPKNHYNVRLELPPKLDSDFPYTEAGKYDTLNFEELVDIIRKHLDREKVSLKRQP
jgi:hypothetical protein